MAVKNVTLQSDSNDLYPYTSIGNILSDPAKGAVVDTNSNQTIGGEKTFSGLIKTNTPAVESNDTRIATTAWVNNKLNAKTVGNGTVTITQGGTAKGSFSVNQTSNSTIALDSVGGLSKYVNKTLALNTADGKGSYLTTVSASAHGKGADPVVSVYFNEGSGVTPKWVEVYGTQEIDSNGNVTLHSNKSISSTYLKVVII